MGEYLSSPSMSPSCSDGAFQGYKYGVCSIQGWRLTMEDEHIVIPNIANGISLFAVMDGHGGKEVAMFTKSYLPKLIKQKIEKGLSLEKCLSDSIERIDTLLNSFDGRQELLAICKQVHPDKQLTLETVASQCGCTCIMILIEKNKIVMANVGDSRAVLCRGYLAVSLSEDHKPDRKEERARIENAKGFVEENRVNGNLNISRTLGDLDYKKNISIPTSDQLVTSTPDIMTFEIESNDKFIIIACDGIWECSSCQQTADTIRKLMSKHKDMPLSKILLMLFQKVVSSNVLLSGGIGADNMTAILLKLND